MVTMNSFSGSDDDYEVYSLPIEVELANDADADDNHWKDSSNSAEAEAAGSKKKSWKYIIPLAIALAVSGAVLGALLSGKRSISMTSLEQLQPAIADEDTKTKSVVKASKSSKSGRGEETFGGGLEAGSMSMSHFSDDHDTFISMSFPSIESHEFCMSFLSIESNSVDITGDSIVSQHENESRPSRVNSKGSKTSRESFGEEDSSSSLSMSMSMPFATRFLEYEGADLMYPRLNRLHDRTVPRKRSTFESLGTNY